MVIICRIFGHGKEVRTVGGPLGYKGVLRNDYIYVYCSRCKTELRRYRDW